MWPLLLPGVVTSLVLDATVPLIGNEWFDLARYAVSILGLIIAVLAMQHRWPLWMVLILPTAVLWNPVWPLRVQPDLWVAAHYIAGVMVLAVGAFARLPKS